MSRLKIDKKIFLPFCCCCVLFTSLCQQEDIYQMNVLEQNIIEREVEDERKKKIVGNIIISPSIINSLSIIFNPRTYEHNLVQKDTKKI